MAWKNVQYENGKLRTSEGGGGGASNFADLEDVNFSNLQNGQVPKYNSDTHKWENADESGGGGTVTDVEVDGVSVVNPQTGVAEIEMPTPPSVPDELSDLSDVQFSNLADHQPLRYNATSQKWVNGADNYPPLIYSDEEREIGVWRDGKPLYQKTVSFSKDSSWTGLKSISHGVSNVDYIFIENATAIANNTEIRDLPNVYPPNITAAGILIYTLNSTDITFYFTNWVGTLDTLVVNVTLRYTKTTDTPGSGTWTTQGGYAHHYSTTEHVIGTWIDGKPLYEKTIHISSFPSANTVVNHGISNLKEIISVNGSIRGTNSGGYYYELFNDHADINSGYSIRVGDIDSTTIIIHFGSGRYTSVTDGNIIMQYTKTTD